MFRRFDELTEQGHRRYAANIDTLVAILEHNGNAASKVEYPGAARDTLLSSFTSRSTIAGVLAREGTA